MVTVLPAASAVPSVVATLSRSLDSSEWNVPEVPSAQDPLMVLGWLGSGPLPSRPSRSEAPESQEIPTTAHLGARSVASKTAFWATALLSTVTLTMALLPTLLAASKAFDWMVWLLPLASPVVFQANA